MCRFLTQFQQLKSDHNNNNDSIKQHACNAIMREYQKVDQEERCLVLVLALLPRNIKVHVYDYTVLLLLLGQTTYIILQQYMYVLYLCCSLACL